MEFQSFILPVGWDANLIDGEGAGETWPVFEWIGEENGETEEPTMTKKKKKRVIRNALCLLLVLIHKHIKGFINLELLELIGGETWCLCPLLGGNKGGIAASTSKV